jgi:hypothetical protein
LVVPQPLDAIAQLAPAETASDGLAIETRVLARLLGLKLLTLEGLVLVSPAAVRRRDAGSSMSSSSASRPTRTQGRASPGNGSPRISRLDARGLGSGLAGAARLLDECTEELRALTAASGTGSQRSRR